MSEATKALQQSSNVRESILIVKEVFLRKEQLHVLCNTRNCDELPESSQRVLRDVQRLYGSPKEPYILGICEKHSIDRKIAKTRLLYGI